MSYFNFSFSYFTNLPCLGNPLQNQSVPLDQTPTPVTNLPAGARDLQQNQPSNVALQPTDQQQPAQTQASLQPLVAVPTTQAAAVPAVEQSLNANSTEANLQASFQGGQQSATSEDDKVLNKWVQQARQRVKRQCCPEPEPACCPKPKPDYGCMKEIKCNYACFAAA
jgi:hypothetical protein